ncbi:WbqC family protein [Crocinitomicaceae bacterium]|nr:WbqC family protein [Crocinitomicaceae bacterium]
MKIAIMQPYFLPYVGYFSLVKASDLWIVFDSVQFIRHGWIERNRILNPNGEWQYIKVPLIKKKRGTKINDMEIRTTEKWKSKILSQLICYKKAPFYIEIIKFLEEAFNEEFDSIVEQNVHLLKNICSYLKIDFNFEIYSDKIYSIEDKINGPGDWAFEITKFHNANHYINPIDGEDLFDKAKFKSCDIQLSFLQNNLMPYPQFQNHFTSGLSIIDVLMFNDPIKTNEIIDSYKIN